MNFIKDKAGLVIPNSIYKVLWDKPSPFNNEYFGAIVPKLIEISSQLIQMKRFINT